ncbi:MAG: 4-vinyl reductase [Candidatus Aenigmatarchaeota archaeon]
MMSSFLSKLLTARQAIFTEEEIEILEMKYVLHPLETLVDFQKNLNDEKKMEEFGYFLFQNIFDHLKKRFSLEESKISDLWINLFNLCGFGKIDLINISEKESIVEIKNNNFARIYISKNKQQKQPVCHIIRGSLRLTFERIYGKKFECKETQCIATGSKSCVFKIISI